MPDDVPLSIQFTVLVILLFLSAFFSSTETALMSLNRYRLRHMARTGHRGARLAESLMQKPERILGLILLGNNLVNILTATLTTIVAIRLWGESSTAAAALVLTVIVVIFAEVTPKTLAAKRPQLLAFPAAYIYYPLLKITWPVIWLLNQITNGVLLLLGADPSERESHKLSNEELRTVVMEGGNIPQQRQEMLASILDLEKVTVDDIMVPRSDVVGVDLEDKWPEIIDLIRSSPYTRLPVFNGELDQLVGILHMRKLVNRLAEAELTPEILNNLLDEPYFVPEGTPLNRQLLYFQQARQRFALVVDEYGDIQGLITMADLLEEIVGEFTSDPDHMTKDIHAESDDCYIVNGAINIRELNRIMNWHLPINGPKTLNGLILEYLETIPEPGTGLKLADYPIEVLHTSDNAVKTVRIHARREQKQKQAS